TGSSAPRRAARRSSARSSSASSSARTRSHPAGASSQTVASRPEGAGTPRTCGLEVSAVQPVSYCPLHVSRRPSPATERGVKEGQVASRDSQIGSAWTGWIGFAGIVMVVIGVIDFFQGLIAVIRGGYFARVTPDQIIVFDSTGWGVIMIIWGIAL